MKNILFFIAIALFSGILNAQKVQNRDSDPFEQVVVFGKLEVYMQKGDKYSIKLESDEVDLDNISTRTDGNELKVSLSEKVLSTSKKAKLTITYNKITKISANGGCEINTNDTIKGDSIVLESLSGSSLYAFIKCKKLNIDASSGSLVSLEGKAQLLEVEAGTRSTFSGYDFKCDSAYVKVNSGAVAKVHAIEKLDASATTKGDVFYYVVPKQLKEKAIMGGKIKKLEE